VQRGEHEPILTAAYEQKQLRSILPNYTITQNAMADKVRLETK
jgi:hypothetical protein